MAKPLSLPCSISIESYHRRAVEDVGKFIEIGGEEYASCHAYQYAKYLPISRDELMTQAKAAMKTD